MKVSKHYLRFVKATDDISTFFVSEMVPGIERVFLDLILR